MHWVSGTWLWAKHRSSRSTGNTIHLEREPSTETRHNRPRTWSLPTSKSSDESDTSTISQRSLQRTESWNIYPYLRCIRCGRLRSREYHYRHFEDPVKYPSIGICHRERTRCARAMSDPEPEKKPEKEPEKEPELEPQHLLDIYELPDTSTHLMQTKSYS
ncbi:hypothetical protein BJX76DRAFT_357844 [Aspergillus varians]